MLARQEVPLRQLFRLRRIRRPLLWEAVRSPPKAEYTLARFFLSQVCNVRVNWFIMGL